MLGWLVMRRLAAMERQLGVSLEYLRHLYRVSPRLFFKFARAAPLANCRRALPKAPFHIAALAAVKREDCGTCVQIGVNMALGDGVDPEQIRAAVEGRVDDLPDDLADVYRFAEAVSAASGDEELYREAIRTRWGEEAIAELALAIAGSRIFPTVKRTLGYATSCSKIAIQTDRPTVIGG